MLSISYGAATSQPGMSIEKVIQMADDAMYANKAENHRRRKDDWLTNSEVQIIQTQW